LKSVLPIHVDKGLSLQALQISFCVDQCYDKHETFSLRSKK